MNHGLSEKTVNKIFSVFERFPEIEKAVLYGSRAKGNFKTGSDIDLTLYGEKLSLRLLGDIAEALDDLLLPYTIDLSIFDNLNHAKLREHIERVGVVFYEKKNQNMKAGWEIKTLGDLFDITSSRRVFESEWTTQGVPFYRAREIVKLAKQGFVDNELFISEEMYNQYANKSGIPKEGDIMVTGVGTLGICYVVQNEDKFYFKDGNIIWLKKKTETNSHFVEYAFQSGFLRNQIDNSAGATVGTYTIIKAKNTLIPIPQLLEQKRLVTLLDEAFESIATAKANAQQNLKNARALFESHLNEVFAECAKKYGHKTVGEISKHSLGKMLDKAKNKGEFKPYLRNINVRWFNFDLSDTLEMKFLPEEIEKYTAVKGDVLICEGGYPGRAAIWQSDEPIFFQKALHRVRFHEIEHNKWFVYFLFSQDSGGTLRQYFTGAGIQHFTGSALKQFKIPIPPIEETKFYVAKFDTLAEETQRLEALYSRKIAALDELKKALLHRAFSGEL